MQRSMLEASMTRNDTVTIIIKEVSRKCSVMALPLSLVALALSTRCLSHCVTVFPLLTMVMYMCVCVCECVKYFIFYVIFQVVIERVKLFW